MNRIPIFFDKAMAAPNQGTTSPSAQKPQQFFDRVVLLETCAQARVVPATLREICRAHSVDYAQPVLAGVSDNGFGTRSMDVAHSLPWTVGSMLSAARHVMTSEDLVACSPTSGFHHAGWAFGGGFCTLNGLMITAINLVSEHFDDGLHVIIVDCDYHTGNGTLDILRHNTPVPAQLRIKHVQPDSTRPIDYLAQLQGGLAKALMNVEKAGGKALVLYQAGADAHIDDPLGGVLNDDQMRTRDTIVFSLCKASGARCVWNLAGGYRMDDSGSIDPVLRTHLATWKACAQAFIE